MLHENGHKKVFFFALEDWIYRKSVDIWNLVLKKKI